MGGLEAHESHTDCGAGGSRACDRKPYTYACSAYRALVRDSRTRDRGRRSQASRVDKETRRCVCLDLRLECDGFEGLGNDTTLSSVLLLAMRWSCRQPL